MLGETIVSSVIFVASCYLYSVSMALRSLKAYKTVGPEFWPQIILILMIVISGILTVSNVVKWKKSIKAEKPENPEEETDWYKFALCFILIIGYVLLLKTVGFAVLTPILIIGIMFLIGKSSIKIISITVVSIMVLVYIVFGKLLYVPLPKGHGIFHDLSILMGL